MQAHSRSKKLQLSAVIDTKIYLYRAADLSRGQHQEQQQHRQHEPRIGVGTPSRIFSILTLPVRLAIHASNINAS